MRAPPGFAIIHVDVGISSTYARGLAAGVRRKELGNFQGSSALGILWITDVAMLEAIACREGLALTEHLALHNFIIASDSKQVVNDIHKGSRRGYGAIISEIKIGASSHTCNFTFEGRALYSRHIA